MSSEAIQGKDVAKDDGEWSVGCVSVQVFGFWLAGDKGLRWLWKRNLTFVFSFPPCSLPAYAEPLYTMVS